MPFTYRNVQADEGTGLVVTVVGEAGGDWFLARDGAAWRQVAVAGGQARAKLSLGQDSAWKLFTKRLDRPTALARFKDITFEGDRELSLHVLDMVSVMA